jgi:outer membrane lipoprotein-sorting protein
MIRKALLMAIAGAVLAVPAQAQSLDEVLNNYYEAIGGVDAWKAIQSMKATGMMQVGPGIEAPFTMTAKRPNKVRIDFTFQGMTGTQAYDGETAWMLMPFMGQTAPEVMPEEDAKDLEEQADIEGILVDWESKGHQVEYIGLEETEGTQAHKLKITLKWGDTQFYFLDAEYFVPIKVEVSREMRGTVVEYETIISDYKEVGDVIMAHSIESKPKGAPAGQVITIQQVEINIEIDDSTFAMPETEGEGQQ